MLNVLSGLGGTEGTGCQVAPPVPLALDDGDAFVESLDCRGSIAQDEGATSAASREMEKPCIAVNHKKLEKLDFSSIFELYISNRKITDSWIQMSDVAIWSLYTRFPE